MSELPSPDSRHPARLASWRSMDAAARGDKQAWLANFAEDAVVEDPVGKSPLDETGRGHRGPEAREAFWDGHIAPVRPIFNLQQSIACGDECANVGTLMIQFPDGAMSKLHGVYIYRVNDAGKVISLRTYWEYDEMEFLPAFEQRAGS